MTCVVGLVTEEGLVFGADSLVTTGYGSKYTLIDKKIFIREDVIVGFCGDLRFGQLIKHQFNHSPYGRHKSPELFMHHTFLPELQKFFLDSGFQKIETGSFDLLVGVERRLFVVSDDFAVIETPSPYQSIGSGCDYALGVMYATSHVADAKFRISVALEAASNFSQTVAKPFHFEILDGPANKKRPKKQKGTPKGAYEEME